MWEERKVEIPEGAKPEELIKVPENAQYFAALGAVEFGKDEDPDLGIYLGTECLEDYISVGRQAEKSKSGAGPGVTILDLTDGGRVFPISPVQTTFNRESTAYFNASCGPTIFRGDALGDAYRGNAFFCESLTNLVQRRVLEQQGPTFLARRVEPDREFLASTDPFFRPVNLTTGPDGALYVIDFYREMVEHPQFVPEELRKSVDFRRWNNRGRLWRISRQGDKARPAPRLGKASTAELTALLEHPNGWQRDTAQRLMRAAPG